MLCGKCEGMLSKDGEDKFCRFFFNKIYNTGNANKLKLGQRLKYGSWLYLFCVGLIFRTAGSPMGFCLNATEMEELLCKCRECLLNAKSLASASSKPDVYLFIRPTEDAD